MNERVDRAAHIIANAALELGERVATLDTEGRCVTTDLYALSLNAAKRHLVHPVRALTATIDLLWGVRDFVRGPKPAPYGYFGPACRLTEYDVLDHFGVTR